MPPENRIVDATERLYRRIPASWYFQEGIHYAAFLPHERSDVDGLSMYRAKLTSKLTAARPRSPRPGKQYYLATLLCSDLNDLGLTVIADPLIDSPGHCLVPRLCSKNRAEDKVAITGIAKTIVDRLIVAVDGPFGPFA